MLALDILRDTTVIASIGAVGGVLVVILLQRALIALRKKNAAVQGMIDASPIAIVKLKANTIVEVWNPAAEKLFGWTAKEVLGKPYPSVPENRRDEFQYLVNRSISDQPIQGFQTQRLRKDGKLVDVCIWNAPLAGRDPDSAGMAMFVDITDQKRMAESLVAAKLEAERANEAKTKFLSQISHEIRNPLTAILGFADLLRTQALAEDSRHTYVDAIIRNGKSISALVNDLLDLARVEAGEMSFVSKTMPIRELLEDVRTSLEVRAASKGLALDIQVNDRVPVELIGDPLRIRQILMNIAGNAVKFTEAGNVVVNVDYESEMLRIRVRDTGPGIPADRLAAVFKPFMQGDAHIAQKHGGTGLGLSLSRELAKLMGGDLTITFSEPGIGSEFAIQIPCKAALQRKQTARAQIDHASL